MTDTKRELKLGSFKDWDAWLSVVRAKATGYSIWSLIDPATEPRPVGKLEPTEPDLDGQTGIDFNEKLARYKIASSKYKKELQDWKEQKDSMAKIINHIYDTTTVTNLSFIQTIEVHPWNVLRALKARLSPSDSARSLELEQQYNRMTRGPTSRQSIDAWLDDYLKMLTLAKQARIAEVIDSKRAYRDFLHAIEKTAPTFAEVQELQLETIQDHEAKLISIIDTFRHHMRMKEARKGRAVISNSAFAADETGGGEGGESGSRTPSFRGKQQEQTPCFCNKKHPWGDCYYINEKLRPEWWTLKPEIVAKIEEAKKDPKTKRSIENSIKRRDEKRQKMNDNKGSTEEVGSFAAMQVGNEMGSFTSDSSSNYALRSSWVLDHGSGIHVTNKTMKQRFVKERDCTDGSMVVSGMGSLPILAYGRMRITVNTPTGKKQMELLNVSYVPDFMVNIVAGSILADKGLHFDTAHSHLHRNGTPVVVVPRIGAHYVLEDNRTSKGVGSFVASASAFVRKGSTSEWHQLLAHANNEAIQHLQQAVEGVELINRDKVPLTNKCEECALSKAHRIVSRSPEKSETSNKPFYRITYDLIDMTTALNKHKWISHIACSETDFHMIYTHESKGSATEVLIRAIHTIETRYKRKVVFVRSDGERSLSKAWDTYCASKGITFEASAVDTPAQNGHSERLGAILLTKSRAMRLEAGLPVYLWPWINETAGYIMNRTPMKRHGWKTPFEMATGKKPNLAHMVKYGAKAYPLDKNVPRKEKMRPKAHIGFLVGYDSTNIFLIWIPSQRKVIRTRDVTFDEDSSYRPNEIDLGQLINEPFLTNDTLLNIPQSDLTGIRDIESDSEEELWDLAPTGSIIDYNADDAEDTFEEAFEEVTDDNERGYLPSPASSSRGENTPNTSDPSGPSSPTDTSASAQSEEAPAPPAPKAKKPKHWQKTAIDEANIQPEGTSRTRKPNPLRGFNYHTALQDASAGGIGSFYGAFTASMIKEKRPHRDNLLPEPRFFHQMLKHPESAGFLRAIDVEIKALQAKQTWKEVSWTHAKEAGKTPIPTTWVFKYKFDEKGYLVKHKARLCARGDLQQTEQDVYAATLAIRIFRALMAIVTAFGLWTRQYDAVNAFANSDIDEPTYCRTPDGWKGTLNILLLLLKALYGLKQSPALWYKHLSTTLNKLGLEQVPGIECLFVCDYMLLFFFVDDIAVMYYPQYSKQVDAFEQKLFAIYEMRNIGEVEWFLNIRITRNKEQQTTSLCQDSYIDKLISKFNIDMTKKEPGSPMANYIPMMKNEGKATPQEVYAYQQKVGSINFAATTTRPDVAAAASRLAEHLTNPSGHHMDQANRTLEYLAYTKNYAIVFDGQASHSDTIFLGSSDASFADDIDTRQSSNGYCFKLFDGLIDWKASKQKTVTTSSTEAELLAMSMTANTKMWWDRFFDTIDMKMGGPTHIECDNRQTIRAFTTPTAKLTTKLRHVDIHRHWLRQEIEKGTITIQWTATTSILADGFTKALSPQKHKDFVRLIGLQRIQLGTASQATPTEDKSSQSEASQGGQVQHQK